jgi:hypothetical protein
VSAALSPDGRMLRLYGVNSTGKNLEVQTTLAGYGQGVRDTQMHILQDAQGALTPEIMNSRDEPERVRVFTRPVNATGQQFALSFAPFSLTLYEFTLDGIAVR